ncbi:hypothetical protein B0H13DRAFT_2415418 [Mycena leptocephala]|nr:hypothetical protein B0H13DRAFT_2415418 [Mycena leptocephala]
MSSHHIFLPFGLDARTHTHGRWASSWSRVWFDSELAYVGSLAFYDWRDSRLTGLALDCAGDALLELEPLADTTPDTQYPTRIFHEKQERRGQRELEREMAQMDAGMGRDVSLRNDKEALRVAIITATLISANKRTEIFLPKIDGSTITLAHILQHLAALRMRAMLLGPESGMRQYAGVRLSGTFGVPLRVYPGMKTNFISPVFLRALRSFAPHGIHLVDPIWLSVQARIALQTLFPSTPIVSSHHMNLPIYVEIFGYPYFHHRTIRGVWTAKSDLVRITRKPKPTPPYSDVWVITVNLATTKILPAQTQSYSEAAASFYNLSLQVAKPIHRE